MNDIVVLGLLINGERADVPGALLKNTRSNVGFVTVKVNGATIRVPESSIMNAQTYFDAIRNKTKLPSGAIGRAWFQEATESEGTRGNLLAEILGNKGDVGDGESKK